MLGEERKIGKYKLYNNYLGTLYFSGKEYTLNLQQIYEYTFGIATWITPPKRIAEDRATAIVSTI